MSEPLLHWIDGESVASVDGTTRTGTDPATGGPGTQVSLGTAVDVDRAVRAAHGARASWRHLGSLDRGRILAAIGRRLLAELDELAALETADTGKPLALSAAEIRGAAEYFEFYAALVNLPAGQVLDIQPNLHVYTLREPLGVVGVITPWNLPLNQAARACAPALAAGNTVVAKPAEATSRTTVELARLAAEEGLPPGVLNVVLGLGPEVGTAIVQHPLVRIPREEIFGPVLVVIPFDTEEEAVALANDSDYGLTGGVFTADLSRAIRVAEAIEAGQVYINSWSTQSVQMPFGGYKHSGYGREKGIEALNHYSHVKSISMRITRR
jgi:acyl-CoA reductase-like NAD-dependent aldehyde dehydrogenase